MTTEFTQSQLATWVAYEAVRAEGEYNMLDQRARIAAGLTIEEYNFVRINYSALKNAVIAQEEA